MEKMERATVQFWGPCFPRCFELKSFTLTPTGFDAGHITSGITSH